MDTIYGDILGQPQSNQVLWMKSRFRKMKLICW